jgi:hypothetical protein
MQPGMQRGQSKTSASPLWYWTRTRMTRSSRPRGPGDLGQVEEEA